MLSEFVHQYADSPRARLFWAAIGVVVLAQVVAIYMLCSHQMQQAQARDSQVQAQRLAVNDCLAFTPQSTIGSCMRQAGVRTPVAPAAPDDSVILSTAVSGGGVGAGRVITTAMPVGFSYR